MHNKCDLLFGKPKVICQNQMILSDDYVKNDPFLYHAMLLFRIWVSKSILVSKLILEFSPPEEPLWL